MCTDFFISFFEEFLVFLGSKKDSKGDLDKAIGFLSKVDSFESVYLKSLVEILLALTIMSAFMSKTLTQQLY